MKLLLKQRKFTSNQCWYFTL